MALHFLLGLGLAMGWLPPRLKIGNATEFSCTHKFYVYTCIRARLNFMGHGSLIACGRQLFKT